MSIYLYDHSNYYYYFYFFDKKNEKRASGFVYLTIKQTKQKL